jgi:dihydrofolate reductase
VSATVLYMSVSLDGFIAGPNERPDNGLGDGGERLHEWALGGGNGIDDLEATRHSGGINGKIIDEFMPTGAVVAGRGTFEPAGGWGGDHHDGVPIFILTRQNPARFRQWPLVTYVDDVTTAMARAREAAGDKKRSRPRCRDRATRTRRRRPRRDRAPCHPGALRPRAPSVRGPRPRADRAAAHPDPRGGKRRHAHALPRAALTSGQASLTCGEMARPVVRRFVGRTASLPGTNPPRFQARLWPFE